MLKGRKPELVRPQKPKLIVSGQSGTGKTFFALDFEKPYFIDCEGGATREQYKDKLIKSGGLYMGKEDGSQDFATVIQQFKELATTKHPYKTVVVDSFSKLYNLEAAKAEERIGNDFGKDKREANKPTRQLVRWIEAIDCTVLLICHKKDKWEGTGNNRSIVGTTFDGWEKLEYDLDLWLEAQKAGKNYTFTVKKSRVQDFIVGNSFPLDYETFCKLYGKEIIDRETEAVILSTVEQIQQIKDLLERVKVEDDWEEKCFTKAGVDSWDQMTAEQVQKAIDHLNKKLKGETK